jgi:hypothetical protein
VYHYDNCNDKFEESLRLELHLKTHDKINPLKCPICEKEFYLNWRLKKHVASHNELNKYCHYFNNAKVCPFQELGCKYKQEHSDKCKFDINCKFKLCQFKHSKKKDASEEASNDKRYLNHTNNASETREAIIIII